MNFKNLLKEITAKYILLKSFKKLLGYMNNFFKFLFEFFIYPIS
jgi:hypothetical protein